MKWIKGILRLVGFALIAVFVLLLGVLGLLYSPWAQDKICHKLSDIGAPDMQIHADYFRLRFPLHVQAGGVSVINRGDTLVAARLADVEIGVLPLLGGKAHVRSAILAEAQYRLGDPDSSMFMTIRADSIALSPVDVALGNMNIDLEKGLIRGGRLAMCLNPDTSAVKQASAPTKMSINVGCLDLDDFEYSMRMMPTIDTLRAAISSAEIKGAVIDLLHQNIHVSVFDGIRLDARYIAPDAEAKAQIPVTAAASFAGDTISSSAPWIVQIDSIAFSRSHALYTTAGVTPSPGLDVAYIEVSDLDLRLHDFYNEASRVVLPLSVRGTERCGVNLAVGGTLDIDSVGLNFKDFELTTAEGTSLAFAGLMGMGDLSASPDVPLQLKLDGALAPEDVGLMLPAAKPFVSAIPSSEDIMLGVNVDGTSGHLEVDELALRLNRCVSLSASGYVENMMQPDLIGGDISLKGNIINVNGFSNALFDKSTAQSVHIPPMALDGHVAMQDGTYNGRIKAVTGKGSLKLDGRWNVRAESYKAHLAMNDFPLNAFMPKLGVGGVTATLNANGHGYNVFSPTTDIAADADVSKLVYLGTTYTGVSLIANLSDGRATVNLSSDNSHIDLDVDAEGNLNGEVYAWNASIDARHVDLYALGLSKEPESLELSATADAVIGPGKNNMSAHLNISDLYYARLQGTIGLSDIDTHFNATDSATTLNIINRDLTADFSSPRPLSVLIDRFSQVGAILSRQIEEYDIDVDTLGAAMPPFALDVRGAHSNLVNDILAPSKMSVRNFAISADKDSAFAFDAWARRFQTGDMRLDSLYLRASQRHSHLALRAGLENRPGNLDQWHKVTLRGNIDGNVAKLRLHQENLAAKTGYEFGLRVRAERADSTLFLSINPFNPVINYQGWTVNEDNFISYRIPTQHIDANLHMHGGNSSLAIYTDHSESHSDEGQAQEDLVIQLSDIHVQDWLSFNPFAPPIKGDVTADVRVNRHDGLLLGKGSAGITNFIYGKEKVADFRADFDVSASVGGTINADADLYVDGRRTITVSGALNDSTMTSPLNLDLSMIHFPLATVNPFLPGKVATMAGTLNGSLKISGTQKVPVLNGSLDFDSTSVTLALTGTPYAFSKVPIEVTDNIVHFNNFSIKGCNDNPLYVDGQVDITDFSNIRMNLGLKAHNMQIVNTNKARRGAEVFGKAFISLDANAHGSTQLLNVNADLSLLPGTNVTYVIQDATNTISNRSNDDMVKFVNFTDSLAVAQADTIASSGMALILDANLNIEEGTTINVDLSADGKDRVSLQSNGRLSFDMTPLDNGRLTGRLNINQGYVRYTPPFMSEKNFSFDDNSYVAFNGDMMNPTLNLHTTDLIKANVTQDGQNSRLINFRVLLAVTGTLNRMNVAFDLATNDDLTVANELESMSAEQRANQAMNLLLYNVYTGPGTKGDASLSGNPLFSFLESQVNSWAANNIRGVDLTFGINQYDRTVDGSTSQTMSYSYQVSKSLFNDRFKIVVGGNYSTDANADENFSQNLINDISFEYFLNARRTMYVRLFRHTGYESILEGEVTQTGVGFVYRRKLRRIGDMFLTGKQVRRREEKAAQSEEKDYVHDHPGHIHADDK